MEFYLNYLKYLPYTHKIIKLFTWKIFKSVYKMFKPEILLCNGKNKKHFWVLWHFFKCINSNAQIVLITQEPP